MSFKNSRHVVNSTQSTVFWGIARSVFRVSCSESPGLLVPFRAFSFFSCSWWQSFFGHVVDMSRGMWWLWTSERELCRHDHVAVMLRHSRCPQIEEVWTVIVILWVGVPSLRPRCSSSCFLDYPWRASRWQAECFVAWTSILIALWCRFCSQGGSQVKVR